MMKKTDFAVIGCALLLAAVLALIFSGGRGKTAEIICGGETVCEINLSAEKETRTIELENGVIIETGPEGIRFLSSPCKNGLCVNTGYINKRGQTAVCLPMQTLIVIKGSEKGSPDAITG